MRASLRFSVFTPPTALAALFTAMLPATTALLHGCGLDSGAELTQGQTGGAPDAGFAGTLLVDKARYAAGESVVVTVTGSKNVLDWVAFARPGSPPTTFLSGKWRYTQGRDGALTFAVDDVAPGAWVVRLLENNGFRVLAESAVFEIDAPVETLALTLDRAAYTVGDRVQVSWKGMPGGGRDWITLVPQGAEPGANRLWRYVETPSGALSFDTSSLPPGSYVVRAHFDDGVAVRFETPPFPLLPAPIVVPDAGAPTDGGVDSGTPPPAPNVCGDGLIEPSVEECDDGNNRMGDLCTSDCRVATFVVDAESLPAGAIRRAPRRLGRSPHPVAVGPSGAAMAYMLPSSSPPALRAATFDARGNFEGVRALSEGTNAAEDADPAVASIGAGSFVVAYTDFDAAGRGDGDGFGVLLRRFGAGAGPLEAPVRVNIERAFNQFGADVMAIGDGIFVAWVDESSATTGRDIKIRRFDANLNGGAERVLAGSPAVESDVVLGAWPTGGAGGAGSDAAEWVAAYRRTTGESQSVVVATTNSEWTVGPVAFPASGERPALVPLDSTRLLVVFTASSDPSAPADAAAGGVFAAVITRDEPSPGAVVRLSPAAASATRARAPRAVRVGDHVLVSWTADGLPGSVVGDEVFLADVLVAGSSVVTSAPRALPKNTLHREGDQRNAVLATGSPAARPIVFAAWEDHGGPLTGPLSRGDLAVQWMAWPLPSP
jgi:cysteine-rich repeat protein